MEACNFCTISVTHSSGVGDIATMDVIASTDDHEENEGDSHTVSKTYSFFQFSFSLSSSLIIGDVCNTKHANLSVP